ncbi:MAG: isoprenylcysteine carboxylmethyltransferase family protein [Candidatus Solibacter sp.]
MVLLGWIVLAVCWVVWGYPFAFRAPHNQKRPSITAIAPTRVGLLLESLGIAIAFASGLLNPTPPVAWRIVASMLCGPIGGLLSWGAVHHLGRQFRVHAGLYEDHQLVTTGPYGIVRHPIYSSMLAMLVSTLLLSTPWKLAILSLALFVAGTEIRVYTEDRLLASRFGPEFFKYQKRVWAYVPYLR